MALGYPWPHSQCVGPADPPGALGAAGAWVGYGGDGHSAQSGAVRGLEHAASHQPHNATSREPPEALPPARPLPDPCPEPCQSPAPRCRFRPDPSSSQEVQAGGKGPAGPTLPSQPARDAVKTGKMGEPEIWGGDPKRMASPTWHNLAEVGTRLKWVRELLCLSRFHFPASNHRHGAGTHFKPTTSRGPLEGTRGDGTVTAH